MAEVLVGFDSAWTNTAKAPGAICALVTSAEGVRFHAPRQAQFADALQLMEGWAGSQDLLLVALDQPTRVPNQTGGRPVERVARSLLSAVSTSVQPARRGEGGAPMFGDAAPLWPFLTALKAREHPLEARTALGGRWLIEVFPALALPSLAPEFWERRRAAKYNPASSNYDDQDWRRVCLAAASYAERLGCGAPAVWLAQAAQAPIPNKALQDRLDAVLCLLVAVAWRRGPESNCMVLGDLATGYIVTPAEGEPRERLLLAAERFGVPVNRADSFEEESSAALGSDTALPPASALVNVEGPRPAAAPGKGRPAVDPERLRTLLISRQGRPISYGEVARVFGQSWTRSFGSGLAAALREVGRENRRRKEPQLMALVVNQSTGHPGHGFYKELGLSGAELEARLAAHRAMCEACGAFAGKAAF